MQYKELAPAIVQYDFPEDLANDIVNYAKSSELITWQHSAIGANHDTEQDYRDSDTCDFPNEMPKSADMCKKIFIDCANDYMIKFGVEIIQDEGLSMLRYRPGNHYDFHSDANWTMYRTVSGLIYLNPQEYSGGETYFKHFDLNVKPENPCVVLFPSNYAYLHAAMPVTEGEKYILVTWTNDLPPYLPHDVMFRASNMVRV